MSQFARDYAQGHYFLTAAGTEHYADDFNFNIEAFFIATMFSPFRNPARPASLIQDIVYLTEL